MLLRAVLVRVRVLVVLVVLAVLAGGGWLADLPAQRAAADVTQPVDAVHIPKPVRPQKPVSLAERRKAYGSLPKSVRAHGLPTHKGKPLTTEQFTKVKAALAKKSTAVRPRSLAAPASGTYHGIATEQVSKDPLGNEAAYSGNPVCLCDHMGAAVPTEPMAESAKIYQYGTNTTTQEYHPVKVTWEIDNYCTSGQHSTVYDFGQTVSAPNFDVADQPGAPDPPVVNAVIPIPAGVCTYDSDSYIISVCTQVTDDPTSTVECGSNNTFIVIPFDPSAATHGCTCGDASGAPRSDVTRGDPVNTATGAYSESFTDASLPAPGVPFSATRSYSSDDTATGALGQGWSLPWETSVSTDSAGNVLLRGEGGAVHGYTKNSDGSFTAADGAKSTLVAGGSGYTLTTLDHRTLVFDSNGLLTSEKNASGQGLTLAYSNGVPATITDAAGRTVTLTYSGGRLAKLALADGRHVDYGYTNGQLTSVTALDGAVATYGYDSGGRLNSVTDALSHRQVYNVYDAQGRVTSQTDADNHTTQYAYTTASVFNETDTTAPDGGVWSDFYAGNMLVAQEDPLGNKSYYRYDAHYNRTDAIDGNSHERSWDYFDNGLLKDKKAGGATESWTYDASGDPATHTDGNNHRTTFTYGANNLLSSVQDANGKTSSYTYWPNGELKTATTPLGKTTSYDYFTDGSLKSVTTAEGRVTTYTYDSSGRVQTVVDPRGNATGANPADYTTTYGYDDADRVISVTDADHHTTSTAYDTAGNVHTVTDAAQRTTTYGYDDANRLTTVTDPAQHTTTYGYDPVGRRTSVTDRTGATTTTAYDKAGDIASMVTARGNVQGADQAAYTWTYGYDHAGNRVSTTDPAGHTTAFAYDTQNRPLSTTDPNGHSSSVTYDNAGNVASRTDGAGYTTNIAYDNDDRLTGVTDPRGHTTTYAFDDDGNLTGQLTALGEHTTYGYDGDGLRTSTVDPRGNVSGADASAFTWHTQYDAAGEPITVTDPLGHTTKTGYDPVGNITSTTDATGNVTSTTYDALNRVATTVAPDGGKTVYAYDTAGNLETVTDPNSHVTTYGHDNEGRVTTVQDPLNHTVSFAYDAEGNRYRTTDARGQTITATIDARDLTGGLAYSDSTPDVTYTYDNAGRIQTVADGTGSRTLTYYDNDKLKSVTAPGTAQPFSYGYNADGTLSYRTYPDGTRTTYGYDNDARITGQTVNGSTVGYAYDAAGHLTTTTLPAGQRSETRAYDNAGNLTKITQTDGSTSTATGYGYNADNLLTDVTATSTGGAQTPVMQYGYDKAQRLHRSCVPASLGADCATATTAGRTYDYDQAGNLTALTDTTVPLDWTGVTQTVSADLNNDGITDVITTDAHDTIRTYLGQADGTFLPGSTLTGTGTGFTQAVPLEYTGDGNVDLLAVDKSTGHLYRYDGDGHGGFAAAHDMGAGWGAMTLVPGDFTKDGKQDFLAQNTSTGHLYFYPGNGDGTFTYANRLDLGGGWGAFHLTALEFTGDGTLDVLVVDPTAGHLYLYPGNGAGRFGTRSDLGGGWAPMQLVAGDFNSDGKDDFLAENTTSHVLYDYPGTGAGTFSTRIQQPDSWTSYGTPAPGRFGSGTTLDIVAPDTTNHLREWHGDGAGHLTGATLATGSRTSYTYDAADELTQAATATAATSYGYDTDGNQTTAGSTTSTYDAAGRLTASTTGSTTYGFTYDADGNRATTTKNGALTDTLRWDPNNPLPQIATETDGTGALTGDYHYDPLGRPQSVDRSTSSSFYYQTDRLGSVTSVLDNTGAQTYHYTYDTYGSPTGTPDITGGQQSAFGFTGAYKDPASTGRLDLRDRILDTATGRFTTRDPVTSPVGSPNPSAYAYADNDPTNLTDPSGDCPMCISALVGAGIGGLLGGTVYAFQHHGDFSWRGFAEASGKGAIIGFGAGLLAPVGGTSAAFLGFEDGTAAYLGTSAVINGITQAAYTWAVNNIQCQPTDPRDLLFSFTGGVFGTYAGPAFRWAKGLFGNGADVPPSGAPSRFGPGAAHRHDPALRGANPYRSPLFRSQIQENQFIGDAYRDHVADWLRQQGLTVVTDADDRAANTFETPHGPRRFDMQVSRNGKVLGYVETKSGDVDKDPDQVAKDEWLQQNRGLKIVYVFDQLKNM